MPKMHQIEFLIEGNLFPIGLHELRVSDSFILKDAWGEVIFSSPDGQQKQYALGFMGVEDKPKFDFFRYAESYVGFFIFIYSLKTGQPLIQYMGIGTDLDNLNKLASHRVGFPSLEILKTKDGSEPLLSRFHEPILSAKETFLELIGDRQLIMDGYLGLALRYYYFALQANSRGHYDEVVINLSIAAEAMFSTGREFTSNLKRRLSVYIEDKKSDREGIAKKIGDFYQLRGVIAHGVTKDVPTAEVKVISVYIRKAIEKALTLKQYSREKLIADLDNNR